jgi:hypothetical protein
MTTALPVIRLKGVSHAQGPPAWRCPLTCRPSTKLPTIAPWQNAASSEPAHRLAVHKPFQRASGRYSKATPRSTSATSIRLSGTYQAASSIP